MSLESGSNIVGFSSKIPTKKKKGKKEMVNMVEL